MLSDKSWEGLAGGVFSVIPTSPFRGGRVFWGTAFTGGLLLSLSCSGELPSSAAATAGSAGFDEPDASHPSAGDGSGRQGGEPSLAEPGSAGAGGSLAEGTGGNSSSGGTGPGSVGGRGTGGSSHLNGGAAGTGELSGGGPSEGLSGAGSDAGPVPVAPEFEECPASDVALAVRRLALAPVAELVAPFDPNEEDTIGPGDWNSNYGKSPEIVVRPYGGGFDVLLQDQSRPVGVVLRVGEDGQGGYNVLAAYEVDLLDRIMGFARDEDDNFYYATGVDEDGELTTEDPPAGVHREDIVRIVKFSPTGCVVMEADVGLARLDHDAESEPIVNPMVAGSSRLAYGGGRLALLHSINTAPDQNGVRHQKALRTLLDADSGKAVATDGLWVSHSFDQRLLWDGDRFIEWHLGDAYPRTLALGWLTDRGGGPAYSTFAPKGAEGDNATYTRLGGIAPMMGTEFSWLTVFTTERSAELGTEQWQAAVGARDVGLVRVLRGFDELDADSQDYLAPEADTLRVESAGVPVDNPVTWLTDYSQEETEDVRAGRARLSTHPDGSFTVFWERWEPAQRGERFTGTYARRLNAVGEPSGEARLVFDSHLSRGDDAVQLGMESAVVVGDAATGGLRILLVDAELQTREIGLH